MADIEETENGFYIIRHPDSPYSWNILALDQESFLLWFHPVIDDVTKSKLLIEYNDIDEALAELKKLAELY